MLGRLFVVEDAQDLAQIVMDVTRYGGAYFPEVCTVFIQSFVFCLCLYADHYQDTYEFIQRRSDWTKVEKTVDKMMYNLSFKEDCMVC
jgi:recyclin-1